MAAARHAHAHAALGDVHGLRQSTDEACRHLEHPEALDTRPPWLYWLTDLKVVTSQTFITAGLAANVVGSPRSADLLAEADGPIIDWLGTHAERTMDRDALLHGTWLARSYLSRDHIEQAVTTATSLLTYASTVRSTHTRSVILDFDADLVQRRDLRARRDIVDLRAQLKDTMRRN